MLSDIISASEIFGGKLRPNG